MGTKANPGKYDCYAKAENDEPMFTLLARDPYAPILVRLWADLRANLGPGYTVDKIYEARECAAAMERWASDHPDHGPFAR